MNVDKLTSRYPGGQFNVYNSENRKEGDLEFDDIELLQLNFA